MERLKAFAIIFIPLMVIGYLSASFVALTFDFSKWSEYGRVLYGFCFTTISLVVVAIIYSDEDL